MVVSLPLRKCGRKAMSGEISIPNVPKPEVRPADRTWHERWWRLMQMRVGYIPIPVALILAALLVVLTWTGSLSPDLTTMIAVLGLAGCILAEIGHRIPWLNQVGGPVIFATFVPAYLVAHRWMPEVLSKPIADFWKTSNFLYLYIATIIVGSILSMNRTVLIGGFLKIFIPLATGTVAAGAIGT